MSAASTGPDLIFTATENPKIWVMTIEGVPDTSLTVDFTHFWDENLSIADLDLRVISDGDVLPPEDPYPEPMCLTARRRGWKRRAGWCRRRPCARAISCARSTPAGNLCGWC